MSHDVTRLLNEWAGGAQEALEELTPLIYDELRRLAGAYLRRESPAHTLQPTALVHEAYLRLVDQSPPGWENRAHFFGIAARLMRQILVDHARSHHARKRGGDLKRASLSECLNDAGESAAELLSLNDALTELERFDPRKAKIIDLHFFGGLTLQETAEGLGISKATVARELRAAEAWIFRHVKGQ
jgi:RNA polymerase sigma factor (TIGR02999 family)